MKTHLLLFDIFLLKLFTCIIFRIKSKGKLHVLTGRHSLTTDDSVENIAVEEDFQV